jgi:hypothetical protein
MDNGELTELAHLPEIVMKLVTEQEHIGFEDVLTLGYGNQLTEKRKNLCLKRLHALQQAENLKSTVGNNGGGQANNGGNGSSSSGSGANNQSSGANGNTKVNAEAAAQNVKQSVAVGLTLRELVNHGLVSEEFGIAYVLEAVDPNKVSSHAALQRIKNARHQLILEEAEKHGLQRMKGGGEGSSRKLKI